MVGEGSMGDWVGGQGVGDERLAPGVGGQYARVKVWTVGGAALLRDSPAHCDLPAYYTVIP